MQQAPRQQYREYADMEQATRQHTRMAKPVTTGIQGRRSTTGRVPDAMGHCHV
jgi:hypothetical protein